MSVLGGRLRLLRRPEPAPQADTVDPGSPPHRPRNRPPQPIDRLPPADHRRHQPPPVQATPRHNRVTTTMRTPNQPHNTEPYDTLDCGHPDTDPTVSHTTAYQETVCGDCCPTCNQDTAA